MMQTRMGSAEVGVVSRDRGCESWSIVVEGESRKGEQGALHGEGEDRRRSRREEVRVCGFALGQGRRNARRGEGAGRGGVGERRGGVDAWMTAAAWMREPVVEAARTWRRKGFRRRGSVEGEPTSSGDEDEQERRSAAMQHGDGGGRAARCGKREGGFRREENF
ncbi:hypothetical protein OsI_02973 [Oryza sativa Indica Group]|uniref:Uncharacterized protein n=1 Tax=Oryza sativa subsp. indica TaxID=39946 RepID=B8ACB0_ORYSI|nr:hypothetical protein OsI_02973 [Oryza sativa Indica Group]